MQIKGKFNIKRGEDQVWSHFLVRTKREEEERRREDEEEEEENEEEGGVKKGMELVWKCYDFVWKLLGYGFLGFSIDIWVLNLESEYLLGV